MLYFAIMLRATNDIDVYTPCAAAMRAAFALRLFCAHAAYYYYAMPPFRDAAAADALDIFAFDTLFVTY